MVTVRPDERVFRGETVALRCDIKWGGDTEWTYRWEREGTDDRYKTQELNISSVDHVHSGKYSCRGQMGTQCSQRSDENSPCHISASTVILSTYENTLLCTKKTKIMTLPNNSSLPCQSLTCVHDTMYTNIVNKKYSCSFIKLRLNHF